MTSQKMQQDHLTRTDLYIIATFVLLFSCLVFWNLGTLHAPETYQVLSQENNTDYVVLNFEEPISVSSIQVYLGYESSRQMALFYYNDESNTEELINDNYVVESVFCWNTIPVDQTSRQFTLICSDSEAYIHELVILDTEGNQILPQNADDYPLLFDEQDYYPEYATYYYRSMFDEVYHARTAYEFIHTLPIYEATHPPLGKILIGIGIRIFGMNPFGWRFVCALFGTFMLPIVYLFSFRLMKNRRMSIFATLLLSTEFMHYTLSRIATIDIIVAFFILSMFYFMFCFLDDWKNNVSIKRLVCMLVLCGFSTGCAIAVKWTGFYAAAGLFVILLVSVIRHYLPLQKTKEVTKEFIILFTTSLLSFILLPCIIYFLSYIPFTKIFEEQNLAIEAYNNFRYMLDYHENVFASHPYASPWYTWLIDRQPLLDAVTLVSSPKASSVATFLNPLIAWIIIPSFIYQIYRCIRWKDCNAAFLCATYLSMLLPWVFIKRTVFIYQYFVCSLVGILMIAYSVYHTGKHQNKLCIVLSIASIFLFILFFPEISGLPASIDYLSDVLEWFPTWIFI